MERITSVQNSKIKEAVALTDSKTRKKAGLILVEGRKLVQELLQCSITPMRYFLREGALPPEGIDQNKIFVVPDNIMKKISAMTTPQDIIAVAHEPTEREFTDSNFILALDTLQDPSNMGAIIRSAEAFGINDIVIGDGCCDIYSQKSLRGAMGSLFRVNMHRRNLKEFLLKKKTEGFVIIGAGLDKSYVTVGALHKSSKKIVVIGNEGNGISKNVMDVCDFGMYIPMSGKNESLNAAVAASIIMWENNRQNNGK